MSAVIAPVDAEKSLKKGTTSMFAFMKREKLCKVIAFKNDDFARALFTNISLVFAKKINETKRQRTLSFSE